MPRVKSVRAALSVTQTIKNENPCRRWNSNPLIRCWAPPPFRHHASTCKDYTVSPMAKDSNLSSHERTVCSDIPCHLPWGKANPIAKDSNLSSRRTYSLFRHTLSSAMGRSCLPIPITVLLCSFLFQKIQRLQLSSCQRMTLTVSHTVVFLRLLHILLHTTAKL